MRKKNPWADFLRSGESDTLPGSFDWQNRFKDLSCQTKKATLLDYYRAPLPDASTPIKEVKLLALDLETTGMDPETDAIVSIGFVPFTLNGIDLARARHMLVKPEMPLSHESCAIHTITHTELSHAQGFHAHFNALLAAMKHHIPVVHYHHMERQFLSRSAGRFFSDPFEFPLIDTMMIEDSLMGHKKTPVFKKWLAKFLGNPPKKQHSLRLDAARQRYHLPRYTPHHALTDAISTAELFMAQVQTHFDPTTALGDFWI